MEGTSANWRTSSYSASNGGQCVEVGIAPDRSRATSVLVRDTADRSGPVLSIRPAAWRALTAAVGEGRFTAADY
ncbi:MAG TPA: DUF397 domain-containing protein [Trebonia sp.]|nr:DUF397 domain-containing protein [Trebonia sp.]